MSAALLAGCATSPGGSGWLASVSPSAPPTDQYTAVASPAPADLLARALRVWAEFPATATPRPLVIVGETVAGPSGGFPSGDAKAAFMTGLIQAPSSLPSSPASAAGYPLISAAAALDQLTAPARQGTPPTSVAPLVVTEVRLGSAQFSTDRGPRQLPAWLVSLQGVPGAAAVLAVAPPAVFAVASPGGPSGGYPRIDRASLGADNRTVTVEFGGAPAGTGPCTADYTLSVEESASLVAVLVIPHPHANPSSVMCTAIAYIRQASATLDSPMGDRLLVDAATALPVSVGTASK